MESSSDTQAAYSEIFSCEGLLQRDSFYSWIISLLNPKAGKTFADISCGQGRLVASAEELGLHTMGIDFAIEALRDGQKHSSSARWIVGDGEQLPLKDKSVDYVTHIGSLEHYIQPGCGAREITRILKPGGIACILLPNAFGLFGNIRYVCSTGDVFDDGQPLQRYGTRRFWERLLVDNGLKIIKVVGYGEVEFPRDTDDIIFLLKKPQKLFRLLLSAFIPVNLSNHFVFICSRA
jgi:SAM-dependent methyltransferase